MVHITTSRRDPAKTGQGSARAGLAGSARLVGATLLAGALAGCVAAPIAPSRPIGPGGSAGAPPATRVEGSWASADGASIATFQNGGFTNRASDTGQAFTAGGRYAYASANEVRIAYTSVVRQEQVNVNCLVVSTAQMNCTNDAGSQFQLFRRA